MKKKTAAADRLGGKDKNSCLEAQSVTEAAPVHPGQHSGEKSVAANGLDGKDKSGCLEDQLVSATPPVSSRSNGNCLVAALPPVHCNGHSNAGNRNKKFPSTHHLRKKTEAADCWCSRFLALKIERQEAKKIVCADCPASCMVLPPSLSGYVAYLHNTLLIKAYNTNGDNKGHIKALMAATGMGISKLKVKAKLLSRKMTNADSQEHGLSMGALNWVLQQMKMPFWLQNFHTVNENLK